MAVVEYMQHKEGHRRVIPEYILDRGHWYNPADHTFIGWIEDNPDYYIPDNLVRLTKQEFLDRILAMHQNNPYRKTDDVHLITPETLPPELTVEEVTTMANTWYDAFVEKNTNPPVTPAM